MKINITIEASQEQNCPAKVRRVLFLTPPGRGCVEGPICLNAVAPRLILGDAAVPTQRPCPERLKLSPKSSTSRRWAPRPPTKHLGVRLDLDSHWSRSVARWFPEPRFAVIVFLLDADLIGWADICGFILWVEPLKMFGPKERNLFYF